MISFLYRLLLDLRFSLNVDFITFVILNEFSVNKIIANGVEVVTVDVNLLLIERVMLPLETNELVGFCRSFFSRTVTL